MNDLRKLARVILIGLGIYVLLRYGIGLVGVLPYLFSQDWSMRSFALGELVGGVVIMIVCVGLVIYALVWKADFWSAKIAGHSERDGAEIWWLPFAFRLASVCTGILYLSWGISALVPIIVRHIQMLHPGVMYMASPWDSVVGWLIELGLGIYLVCGAPHFVRWQVKKTIEQCKRFEGEKKVSEEDAAP